MVSGGEVWMVPGGRRKEEGEELSLSYLSIGEWNCIIVLLLSTLLVIGFFFLRFGIWY